MKNQETEVEKIIELLIKKKNLLIELLNLSRYHKKYCLEERYDKLNRLVISQCIRIKKMKKIDKKLAEIDKGLIEIFSNKDILLLSRIDKQSCSEVLAYKEEIKDYLEEFYEVNQKNQEFVNITFRKLKEKKININRAKKVRNVYLRGLGKSCGFFLNRIDNMGNKRR